MKILDLSAGKRNIWFNKLQSDVVFIDLRPEMAPTVIADSTALPFPDGFFDLIIFDPPHMTHGKNSSMAEYYSSLPADEIKHLVWKTAAEAYRVSVASSFMAFKWNDHDVRLDHTLPLMEGWEPLFGHQFKFKKSQRSTTSWMLLRKRCTSYENASQIQRVLAMDGDDGAPEGATWKQERP